MDLDEWLVNAPHALRESPTWKVRAYQIGAFIAVRAADDAALLERLARFSQIAPQLLRAAGSVAANVAEGDSRRSSKDRIRYYEYALGSARECTTWYVTAAAAFERTALDSRLAYLARASQLLLTMIKNERSGANRPFPSLIR